MTIFLIYRNQQNQSLEDKILNSDVPDSIREGILVERLTKHNTGVKVSKNSCSEFNNTCLCHLIGCFSRL